MEESLLYDDLLVVDVGEHYHNITLKVLHTFKWFNNLDDKPKYLFKTDDDSYVNLNKARKLIDKKLSKTSVGALGQSRTSTAVVRVAPNEQKEFTTKNECPTYMYNGAVYPNMLHGAGKKSGHSWSQLLRIRIDGSSCGMLARRTAQVEIFARGRRFRDGIRKGNLQLETDIH